jgi:hypothetical protein
MKPSSHHDAAEEYEVINSCESFTFGFSCLGVVVVITLIFLGCLAQHYAVCREPATWIGAGTAIALLGIAFRSFLFGKTQLQIGSEGIRIVESSGQVSLEAAYAEIARIELFRKTTEVETDSFQVPLDAKDVVFMSARAALSGPTVSTLTDHVYLGLRFHDACMAAVRDPLAVARYRGSHRGFDWVFDGSTFEAPLAVLEQKLRARWEAFLEKNNNGVTRKIV